MTEQATESTGWDKDLFFFLLLFLFSRLLFTRWSIGVIWVTRLSIGVIWVSRLSIGVIWVSIGSLVLRLTCFAAIVLRLACFVVLRLACFVALRLACFVALRLAVFVLVGKLHFRLHDAEAGASHRLINNLQVTICVDKSLSVHLNENGVVGVSASEVLLKRS